MLLKFHAGENTKHHAKWTSFSWKLTQYHIGVWPLPDGLPPHWRGVNPGSFRTLAHNTKVQYFRKRPSVILSTCLQCQEKSPYVHRHFINTQCHTSNWLELSFLGDRSLAIIIINNNFGGTVVWTQGLSFLGRHTPFEPCLFVLSVILCFCLELASVSDPLTYASCIDGIINTDHQAWLIDWDGLSLTWCPGWPWICSLLISFK
jgi:hypothetical protein